VASTSRHSDGCRKQVRNCAAHEKFMFDTTMHTLQAHDYLDSTQKPVGRVVVPTRLYILMHKFVVNRLVSLR